MKKTLLVLLLLTQAILCEAQNLGVYRWAGKIAGPNSEYPDWIRCDASGNVYVSGRFEGTVDFDPGAGVTSRISNGSSDVFLAKYTTAGSLVWVVTFGGTGADRAVAHELDASGNIYVAGYYLSTVDFDPGPGTVSYTSAGATDFYFSKFDNNGNLIWANSIGYLGTDYAQTLALDNNGALYISGEFTSDSIDFDPGPGVFTLPNSNPSLTSYDPYLAKYDTSGTLQWVFGLGGTSSDFARSVVVAPNGDVLLGGYFSTTLTPDPAAITTLTSIGLADCYIARYTSAGSLVWAKGFGGGSTDNLLGLTMHGDSVFSTGTFNSIVDFDPGNDTLAFQSAGLTDAFISKLDNAGNLIWARAFGSNPSETATGICANAAGEVYIAGSFNDTTNLDASNTAPIMNALGLRDGFITKYSATGDYVWGNRIGSSATDYCRFITLDPSGDIWTTGYYGAGTLYPDQTNLSIQFTNSGVNDGFLARYGECAYPVISSQPVTGGTCVGGTYSYTVTATGSNITYQWQEGTNGGITWTNITNGGIFSGATTATLTLSGMSTASNNLFYRCIISADCGLNITSGVGILFVGNPDTTVNVNQHILVAAQNNATYQWLDCNNGSAPISGATTQQFIPTTPGTYALAVTRNGCTDTSACYTIATIGINEISENDIRLFPVPATDVLQIEMNNAGNYEATIFDLTGRNALSSSNSFTKRSQIDVRSLESGAYLIAIRNNGGAPSYFRIIIE